MQTLISLNTKYEVGTGKFIEPVSIEWTTPMGNHFFNCIMHRACGKKSENIYHTYHIQALIHRFVNR